MIFLRNYYVDVTAKIDIKVVTEDVKRAVRESNVPAGTVLVLLPGGAAGLALLERDPKIYEAYRDWVVAQVPDSGAPRPSRHSGSGRNEAHLRAALIGNQVVLPLSQGKLILGAWQEIVLFDFDDKVGRREITVQVHGEGAAPAKG